ncbi:MAG: response regulator [Cyclobacteriaceae bacterium]
MSEYLRVLVVHRQISVANDIKKQFDSAGWLVHMAQSGLDGLLAARKESFSLILCAIDLPVITGIEMVRGIRNFSFNVNTPTVFIGELPDGNYSTILEKLKAKIHLGDLNNLSELIITYGHTRTAKDFMRIDP